MTVGATLLMGGVADAACTCTVDSLADPTDAGHTTLRDAITSANANPGSTISFASGLSGAITLASGLPQINQATTIAGPGAGQLAVSGANSFKPFYVNTAGGADVTISGLTITGGAGVTGGGIRSKGADLTISGDVISGNTVSAGNGGGIDVGTGTLTVSGSTVSGNTANTRGGGIDTAQAAAGATIIRSSTISGNNSGTDGGGVYFNYAAPATVENSTIYGNTATDDGGGIYDYGPSSSGAGLTVTGSTITHNTADRGGGIASYGNSVSPAPIIQDTIVSANTAATGPDLSASDPGSVTNGYCGCSMDTAFSLIGGVDPDTTINDTVPGSDIFGQDPQLGPLASNGGPTQTQRPALSSPAVDQGSAFGLTTDQRGQTRPFDFPSIANSPVSGADGSDMGAVEFQTSDIPVPPPAGGSTAPPGPTGQRAAAKRKCKKKFRHNPTKRKKCLKRAKRLPV